MSVNRDGALSRFASKPITDNARRKAIWRTRVIECCPLIMYVHYLRRYHVGHHLLVVSFVCDSRLFWFLRLAVEIFKFFVATRTSRCRRTVFRRFRTSAVRVASAAVPELWPRPRQNRRNTNRRRRTRWKVRLGRWLKRKNVTTVLSFSYSRNHDVFCSLCLVLDDSSRTDSRASDDAASATDSDADEKPVTEKKASKKNGQSFTDFRVTYYDLNRV